MRVSGASLDDEFQSIGRRRELQVEGREEKLLALLMLVNNRQNLPRL